MALRALLLLALLTGTAQAMPTLVLNSGGEARVDLRAYVAVLDRETETLDVAGARSRATDFRILPPGAGLNFGYRREPVWLRLRLRSDLHRASDWRIELDYASLDHADLYIGDSGPLRAGDRLPLSGRALPHRNSLFPLHLAAGESVELLLRVQSEGSLTVNPILWRADAFMAHSENSYAAHALYFGMLLALAAYNALLFVALRDRAFLLYVLFVVGIGIGIASIYGLAGQYLWPNAVNWSNRALVVSFAVAGIVGPLFTRDFLDTARRAPAWHRWLLIAAAVHVVMLGVGLWAPLRAGMQLMSISALLNCMAMLGCGIACGWRAVPGARLFVLAWAVLLLGGMLMALRNFGVLPTHFVTLHGMQIGSVLEMLLLSFALAERINQVKHERGEAQAQALQAQQELVAHLQRQERELEHRVAERTEELAEANAQLRERALRDPLTGLANRVALYAHMELALHRARRRDQPCCLLMVDLDGFKAVNDRYGHEAGDRLLKEVADRLKAGTRAEMLLARLGGDEFVLVAEGLDLPEQAERIAQRLLLAVSEPYVMAPEVRVGASIGIALSAGESEDSEALLRRADTAMYAAKAAGRGTLRWALAEPATVIADRVG